MIQRDYSIVNPSATLEIEGRTRKAKMTLAVLDDYFNQGLSALRVLDAAASGGIIANHLAEHCRHVIGVDIDQHAILFARNHFDRPNLEFRVADSCATGFPDSEFDVILCSHLYEHVSDASALMREFYRLLEPGGICYFAAGNRINLIEPHYHLPFLSLLPKAVAHLYLRLARRGKNYEETHLTYWGLQQLVKDFELIDYTCKIVRNPSRYNADHMLKPTSSKTRLAIWVCRFAYWLMPGYIWILRKPTTVDR